MTEMGTLGKLLIFAGILLVALGVFFTFGWKYLPLGRLPGDIGIRKGDFTFIFPVATCILISLLLTVFLNFFFRR